MDSALQWPHPKLIEAGQRLRIDRAIVEVAARFCDLGLEPVLLKGPTLARWLYPEGGRLYGDIDLLLSPGDVSTAGRALEELGFAHQYEGFPHDRPSAAVGWERTKDETRIEVHKTLTGIPMSPARVWQRLSDETVPFEIAREHVSALNLAGRSFHVALHAAQHGKAVKQPLEDLRRALQAVPIETWRTAKQIADDLDALDAFTAGLRMVPEGRATAEGLNLPTQVPLYVAMRAEGARPSAWELEWLARTEGVAWKFALILRKIFPPPDFLRIWFPRARKGDVRLALAYLYRPVWLGKELVLGLVDWFRFWRRARHPERRQASRKERPG